MGFFIEKNSNCFWFEFEKDKHLQSFLFLYSLTVIESFQLCTKPQYPFRIRFDLRVVKYFAIESRDSRIIERPSTLVKFLDSEPFEIQIHV